MDLTKETEQRKEFCAILFELSKSQENFQEAYYRINLYKRLKLLYDASSSKERFRHFYSDIFSVLSQVRQNPELGDINILGQNLDMIRNGYQPKNYAADGHIINVSDAINKLYDHVNLEIARMLYSDAGDRKLSGEEHLQNLQSEVNQMTSKIDQVQKNVEEKISRQQKEYISILGIFAAVVLAFTGGIAFSTSVLNNIAQASAYRTLMVGLIIGLILVNVLFGLFYYINRIVSNDGKLKPLIISNVIILLLITGVVLAWNYGYIELRNNRIHNSISYQQTE